jgi:hypothetical protein
VTFTSPISVFELESDIANRSMECKEDFGEQANGCRMLVMGDVVEISRLGNHLTRVGPETRNEAFSGEQGVGAQFHLHIGRSNRGK